VSRDHAIRPGDGRDARPAARQLAALGAVGAAALALLGAAQTGPGRSALRDLGVAGATEPYTELAFARPDALPARLPRGTSTVALPFSLRDREAGAATYRWRVQVSGNGPAQTVAAGVARAVRGGTAFAAPRVRIRCDAPRVRINVLLAGRPESIGLWAQCAPAGSGP
jgi:hypothetical protein